MYEICSKLTIKVPEPRHCCRSGSLMLTLNKFHTYFYVSIVELEQIFVTLVKIFQPVAANVDIHILEQNALEF